MVPANFLKERIAGMNNISDLEFLRLSKAQKIGYKLRRFFTGIPGAIARFFLTIWHAIQKAGRAVGREAGEIASAFTNGDWKTKLSFFIMGFGSLARGQVLRGMLFLLFEIIFIGYMILSGGYWLSMLPTLGTQGPTKEYNALLDVTVTQYHDNSFQILLYGVLTIFFIIAFLYTWRVNIRQNRMAEKILATGKPLKSGKDDLTVWWTISSIRP